MKRLLHLAEVFRFFQNYQWRCVRVAIFFFVGVFFLTLFLSKPFYRADATFYQAKGKSEASSLETILRGIRGGMEEVSAVSIMQTRGILKKVVEQTGLQIEAVSEGVVPRLIALLKREMKRRVSSDGFLFRQVHFEEESPKPFFIRVIGVDSFELYDEKRRLFVRGKQGESIQFGNAAFVVQQLPERKGIYAFVLQPKRNAVGALASSIKIKAKRLDPSMIQLSCTHKQRTQAIAILDTLMREFQNYLKQEHEQLASGEISYLQKRQNELGRDLNVALLEQEEFLKQSLGVEGFLNLTQEITMLSEPKERYMTRREQLDLEQKRWKRGESIATELAWEGEHLPPIFPSSSEEFAGLDLETVNQFYKEYSHERDKLAAETGELEAFRENIDELRVKDPIGQQLLQKRAELSAQLLDTENHTPKELQRIREKLTKQTEQIEQYLTQMRQAIRLKMDLVERKMAGLQRAALNLIEKEKEVVDTKLHEITAKMRELPQKWHLESQLNLKKDMAKQIIEEITRLCESKIIDHQLFHLESKPIDVADAPLNIQPPHLFLYASLGGIVSAFLFLLGLFFAAALHGFPLSKEYLTDLGFTVVQEKGEHLFHRISLDLKPGETLALLGNGVPAEGLIAFLRKQGKEVVHLKMPCELKKEGGDYLVVESQSPIDSIEALECRRFADRFIMRLTTEKEQSLLNFPRAQTLALF